tara:strand:+ start:2954 stop:4204 length:1251 start_codon:yes stop_codon:yes gene_type:complete
LGFGQAEYQQLLDSIETQRQTRSVSYLPARHFEAPHKWASPGQAAGHIVGNRLVTTPPPRAPRIQQEAIRAIRDYIRKTEIGRSLLAVADRGKIAAGFEVSERDGTQASYYYTRRDILFNGNSALLRTPDVETFISRAAYYGIHELGHVAQDQKCGRNFCNLDLTVPLSQRIMAVRHFEAAADAIAIQAAWEAKQAGDPALWEIANSPMGDPPLAQAFERSVRRRPDNAHNGKARRAAHDAWFKAGDGVHRYDQATIDRHRFELDCLAVQQAEDYPDPTARLLASDAGKRKLRLNDFRDFGVMPDGGDHLRLQGHADVLDPRYTAPSSEAITRQVKYIEALVERVSDGMAIYPSDFDDLDKLKAGAVLPDQPVDADEDMSEPQAAKDNMRQWRAGRQDTAMQDTARREADGPSMAP